MRCERELLDRKSTRLNSSHTVISYAVFCLKKKKYRTSRAVEPTDTGTLLAEKLSLGFATIQDGIDNLVLYREAPIGRLRLNFFFNDTATTEIYTLSLHDALPI